MRRPASTYRIQLSPEFGFEATRRIVPYVQALGATDLYLSPIAEARTGSPHGYDIVDPTRIRGELGGEAGFRALAEEARARGLGILLDIVPNHLAASHENAWWWDLLERGRSSAYAEWFDIDWERAVEESDGRIVLPVLGRPLGEAIAAGEIAVEPGTEPEIRYGERRLPTSPETRTAARALAARGRETRAELEALLAAQPYRLVEWRRAGQLVNYRRFFNIADLIGMRVEEPTVFEALHELPSRLLADGWVTGLRVDHVDGLADPQAYLERLQRLPWPEGPGTGYIIVEKILAPGEALPEAWPVAGTTGYDFLARTDGLFVDPGGFAEVEAAYRAITGLEPDVERLLRREKRRIAADHFRGEIAALARRTARLLGEAATEGPLARAWLELSAALAVYRTYVRVMPPGPRDRRVVEIALEAARSSTREPSALDTLGELLLGPPLPVAAETERLTLVRRWQQLTGAITAKGVEDTAFYVYNPLIGLNEVGSEPGQGPASLQDFHAWAGERARHHPSGLSPTSTHDTKRSADVRARIAVLSEIPERWTGRLAAWREWNRPAREATAGGPAPSSNREVSLYQTLLGAWPLDPAAVPAFRRRLSAYLTKAVREARRHSSWTDPNRAYEAGVTGFAERILEGESPFLADFLAFQREIAFHGMLNALAQLLLQLAAPGVPDIYQGCETWRFSLVDPDNRRPVDFERLKAHRARLGAGDGSDGPEPESLAELREGWPDGRIKMLILARGLAIRRARSDLFGHGSYSPLTAEGPHARHVIALHRRWRDQDAVAVAPRWTTRLVEPGRFPLEAGVWGATAVRFPDEGPGTWRSVFDGRRLGPGEDRRVPVAGLLSELPVALLIR